MATSSHPFFAKQTPKTQVIAHVSLKMAQTVAMVTPPIFILASMIRRNPLKPFSIRRMLNTTTRATVLGAGVGGVMGYGRLMNQSDAAILDRATRLVSASECIVFRLYSDPYTLYKSSSRRYQTRIIIIYPLMLASCAASGLY